MAAQKSITFPTIDTSDLDQTWYSTFGNSQSHGTISATGLGTGHTYSIATHAAPMTLTAGGKIELKGESADITINGASLKDTLAALQERLNWMQPNPELETEWDQLRELGDRYRELEQQCKEKSQMWTNLRTLPKTNQS